MIARILASNPKPESIDAAVEQWPHHIGMLKGKGLVRGYLFVDRAACKFLSITIWESKQAQERNAGSPEQAKLRTEFMKHLTGAPVASVFEVAAAVD